MRSIRKTVSGRTPAGRSRHPRAVYALQKRVNLLTGKDKVLMRMYLENGASFRQISGLTGISEQAIARRIQKLARRLAEGQYIDCLRHRDKLTARELNIAKDYFLKGLSMRSIAAKYDSSYYRVRKAIGKIQYLLAENPQPTRRRRPNTKCEV